MVVRLFLANGWLTPHCLLPAAWPVGAVEEGQGAGPLAGQLEAPRSRQL